MPHFMRLAAALLLAAIGVEAVHAADDVQLSAFYGRYEGTAVVEKLEGLYYGINAGDMDFQVGPTATGFFVQWTNVEREKADPASQNVRRAPLKIEFVPAGHSGAFRAANKDSKVGNAYAWANLTGQTLRVSMLAHDETGFELQTYERSITPFGLTLELTRNRNAQQVLLLRGRAIRVSQ